MSNLATRYRPQRFEDLAGQRPSAALLRAMTLKKTLPNVLLLEGTKGSGKTTTARIIAAALNCLSGYRPCGECESCLAVFEGASLAVREIDASSHGLVDDIRQLQDSLMYSVPGITSVLIIDEAQGLSRAASNALLKTLEFPPENTVFILITTELAKILPTIRSRCMIFSFKPIPFGAILERLRIVKNKENFKVSDEVLTQIALRSQGSLRDGLLMLDQLTRAGVVTVQQFETIYGERIPGLSLLRAMLSGRHSVVFAQADKLLATVGSSAELVDSLISVLKDIVILKAGGVVVFQGDDLLEVQSIARDLDTKSITVAMRALWDTKIKIRNSDSAPGIIYLMLTTMMDCFGTADYTQTDEQLTFDQMSSMNG